MQKPLHQTTDNLDARVIGALMCRVCNNHQCSHLEAGQCHTCVISIRQRYLYCGLESAQVTNYRAPQAPHGPRCTTERLWLPVSKFLCTHGSPTSIKRVWKLFFSFFLLKYLRTVLSTSSEITHLQVADTSSFLVLRDRL